MSKTTDLKNNKTLYSKYSVQNNNLYTPVHYALVSETTEKTRSSYSSRSRFLQFLNKDVPYLDTALYIIHNTTYHGIATNSLTKRFTKTPR